jgi:hypothetical protein
MADGHRMDRGRLGATDPNNLSIPLKVALRTRERVAQSQEKLLKCI